MIQFFTFYRLLSSHDRSLFAQYYRDLRKLDQDSLVTALRTGRILEELQSLLSDPKHWQEFIEKGLQPNIDEEQVSCLINLAALYDSYNCEYVEVFEQLSVGSLLHLCHPSMPLQRQLFLLSEAKRIKEEPEFLTLQEFERIIAICLKVSLFNQGIDDPDKMKKINADYQ